MLRTSFARCSRRLFALPLWPLASAVVVLLAGACAQDTGPVGNNAATPHPAHAVNAAPQAKATPRVPDHFLTPAEAQPFPVTLDPNKFSAPAVIKAYQLAKDIPAVLAQQPCYCYCDAGHGHKSLLHCHIDDHSAT